jgi:SRSO17 transposase
MQSQPKIRSKDGCGGGTMQILLKSPIMKKTLLFAFCVSVALCLDVSQPSLFSPISVPKNEMVDLTITTCNEACLASLLENEKFFSFLAKYDNSASSQLLSFEYQRLSSLLNLRVKRLASDNRIAVLVPVESIGRYSVVVTNSVNAYMLFKGSAFEVEVFDSTDESPENLEKTVRAIESNGYLRVIAALTPEGAATLSSIQTPLRFFIPTVNKNDMSYGPDNFYFGGINYTEQLLRLAKYRASDQITIFDEQIALSRRLAAAAQTVFPAPPKQITLDNPRVNFTQLFRANGVESGSVILLNTQPVRTSLILSQLTFNDIKAAAALSTQINYSPMLLTLPQSEDVTNLFIASSIGDADETLREINELLQSDLRYNWTAYAAGAMTALICQMQSGDFSVRIKDFNLEVVDNQIEYPILIYQIAGNRFIKAPPPSADSIFD